MQRVSFLLEMVVLKEGRDRNGLNSLVAACLQASLGYGWLGGYWLG
jgi:hypothetical protein